MHAHTQSNGGDKGKTLDTCYAADPISDQHYCAVCRLPIVSAWSRDELFVNYTANGVMYTNSVVQ